MPRYHIALLAAVLLLGTAVTQEKADEPPPPPAGTWRMMLPMLRGAGNQPLWLIQIEKKGDGYEGKVLDTAPKWPKGKVSGLSVTKERLKFSLDTPDISFPCDVKLPEGKADKLLGLATVRKTPTPVELVRSDVSTLDPFDLDKDELAKKPLGVEAVQLSLNLLARSASKKAKAGEVRAWAEKAVKSADLYGPAWQRDIILTVAEILSDEKEYAAIAVQYARRAERTLEGKEPPAVQKRVYTVLSAALENSGKADEAKEMLAKMKKLDFRLKPKEFAGRKGKSERVVLVELFTGAQCPPCVAADLAFDALTKTYKPSEVVLLQYHVHVPGPDPLTNPDSEARFEFYEEAKGTPNVFANGKKLDVEGGQAEDAAERYEEFVEGINPLLEKEADGKLALAAKRKGDKITIEANVSGLKKSGDDVRLRLAVVEKEVDYKGRNGLAKHSHVVRFMPGGDAGTVMKAKDGKYPFTVDVAEVKKRLADYLKKSNDKRPFPDDARPMELKELSVVAFVQDDRTQEVLQAAIVPVKAEE
jgi:hypothetical protein